MPYKADSTSDQSETHGSRIGDRGFLALTTLIALMWGVGLAGLVIRLGLALGGHLAAAP